MEFPLLVSRFTAQSRVPSLQRGENLTATGQAHNGRSEKEYEDSGRTDLALLQRSREVTVSLLSRGQWRPTIDASRFVRTGNQTGHVATKVRLLAL